VFGTHSPVTRELTPNAFESLFELEASILAFEERYQAVAKPFEWKYTRDDLAAFLARLTAIPTGLKIPAREYVTELPNKTT